MSCCKGILDVCTRGEVHVFLIHVEEHAEVFLRLTDVETPGVPRRDGRCAIFRNDGGIIVDEKRWDIALWSKAWADSLMRRSVAIIFLATSGRGIFFTNFDVGRFSDCGSGFSSGTSLLTLLRSTMKV